MDLNRVGIYEKYGQLNTAQAAVLGLLQYPDFYKVGIQTFLLDSRMLSRTLVDQYNGPKGSNSRRVYLEDMVDNLEGKLMLMMSTDPDWSQHGASSITATIRLAGALATANKDFDLVIDDRNSYMVTTYQIRRGWDYLVRHLQGNEPPKEFELTGIKYWDPGWVERYFADMQRHSFLSGQTAN